MLQACDRADFLVTCSCFQQEKPAKDCHNCLTCDFGIIKKVFWKCRIFPDTLSLSLQLMYFTVSLSVRLLRLSSKIDISPSSSLYLWWNHQLFCRIVFNLQFIGEAQCFGRKRFFPLWQDLSPRCTSCNLCSQQLSTVPVLFWLQVARPLTSEDGSSSFVLVAHPSAYSLERGGHIW